MKSLSLKRVLFRLHWITGLTAGLVLALMGFTGALTGLREPISALMNPQLQLAANARAPLPPDRWIEIARAADPDLTPRNIAWSGDAHAVSVRMMRGRERAGDIAVEPYEGRSLGVANGAAFFDAVEQLHRNLLAGAIGKQVVGACAALLILLAATGLYLRWPRHAGSLKAWFRLDGRLRGRAFLRQLHALIGTWVLLMYFVSALTGLWWAWDFYRDAINRMAGVETPARRAPAGADAKAGGEGKAVVVSLDKAWTSFRLAVPDASEATVAIAGKAGAPVEVRYLTAASPHNRAFNTLKLDAASGDIVSRENYADLPPGRRFVASMFPLHSGSILGWPGRIVMALAALQLPLFAITGIWMWLLRRRHEAARRRSSVAPTVAARIDSLQRADARAR